MCFALLHQGWPQHGFLGGVVWPKATRQSRNLVTEVPRSGAEGAAAGGLGGGIPPTGSRGEAPGKFFRFLMNFEQSRTTF